MYLTLTLWFWTLTPFIRRVIDYRAGFDAMNVILVTPNLMALFMLQDLLGHAVSSHRGHKTVADQLGALPGHEPG